jgi:hypothetical protein
MQLTRPELFIDISQANQTEAFAHSVVRPVLKQLNANLLAYFFAEIKVFHKDFDTSDLTLRKQLTQNFFKKNLAFKNQILGMFLGLLSATELEFYLANSRELAKRYQAMALQRVLSQMV